MSAKLNQKFVKSLRGNQLLSSSTSPSLSSMELIWLQSCPLTADLWPICLTKMSAGSFSRASSRFSTVTKSRKEKTLTTTDQQSTELWNATKFEQCLLSSPTCVSTRTTTSQATCSWRTFISCLIKASRSLNCSRVTFSVSNSIMTSGRVLKRTTKLFTGHITTPFSRSESTTPKCSLKTSLRVSKSRKKIVMIISTLQKCSRSSTRSTFCRVLGFSLWTKTQKMTTLRPITTPTWTSWG